MESLLCPCTSIKQVLHLYKSSSVCVLWTKHKATSYAVRKMISENGFSGNQFSKSFRCGELTLPLHQHQTSSASLQKIFRVCFANPHMSVCVSTSWAKLDENADDI